MKRIKRLSIVLVAAMIFLVAAPMAVFGASEPVYSGDSIPDAKIFVANGTPITITDNGSGGTLITWDGVGSPLNIPDTEVGILQIYGGSIDSNDPTTSSITMTGGTVASINGGGYYAPGVVSTVTSATINITGGTVLEAVAAGGIMDGSVSSLTESMDPNTALNIVETATITIGSGVATGSAAWIYAGGTSGMCYVGSSTINVAGGNWAGLTAGGSNGYVGQSTINITGGTFGNVHGNNHGSVGSATFNISGGTITDLFAGADVGPDTRPDVAGTIESSVINVTGGSVTNISIGFDVGGSLARDPATQATVTLNYDTNFVTNVEQVFLDAATGYYIYIDGVQYLADAGKPLSSNTWFSAATTRDGQIFTGLVDAQDVAFAADTLINQTYHLITAFIPVDYSGGTSVAGAKASPQTSDSGAPLAEMSFFLLIAGMAVLSSYLVRRKLEKSRS